jgi:hypothetical protein
MIRKLRRDQKNTVSTSSSAESICLSYILEQYILVHAVSTHLNGIFAAALSTCLRPFRHFIVFDQRITACDYFFLRFVVQFLYFLPATHGQQNDHREIFDSLQLLYPFPQSDEIQGSLFYQQHLLDLRVISRAEMIEIYSAGKTTGIPNDLVRPGHFFPGHQGCYFPP